MLVSPVVLQVHCLTVTSTQHFRLTCILFTQYSVQWKWRLGELELGKNAIG